MTELVLTVTSQADPVDLERIGSNLAAFNEGDAGPAERQPIAILVRADDDLVAGLSGYTAWGWLYVQWLWIGETYRGQNLAGRMLANAETEARSRKCHGAYIDTFNPQAVHVYQKAGYTVFGALPDFPPGRVRSFLSKSLT